MILFPPYRPFPRVAESATVEVTIGRIAGDFDWLPYCKLCRAMHIDPSEFNDVTGRILAGAIEVHRTLGPGLLESLYTPCLQFELTARQMRFVVQRSIPIVYKGMSIEACYRIDLIVEDVVVVEVKSSAAILPVHQAQLLTYMQLTGCPVGLLINFNVPRLTDGVRRLINPRVTAQRRTEVTEATGLTRRNGETDPNREQ